jgi:ketosteroid isomerase-like protein
MKSYGSHVLVFIALITAVLSPAHAAAQDATDSAESKIVALEKAWNQAYKFRDKKALSEILDPSMTLVNVDGSIQSRGTFLAGFDLAPSSDQQQADPESISVHVFGEAAVATGVFWTKSVENGKLYARRNRFVDTWIKRNGSWVCIAATAVPILH